MNTKNYFALFSLIFLINLSTVIAKNRLEPCRDSDVRNWNFCYGEIELPYGNKYIGEFKNGKFHGDGAYIYTLGRDKYEGQFKGGDAHGLGIFYYSNGNKYQGYFEKDLINGEGILTYANGRIEEGIWSKGKLIKTKKIDSNKFKKINLSEEEFKKKENYEIAEISEEKNDIKDFSSKNDSTKLPTYNEISRDVSSRKSSLRIDTSISGPDINGDVVININTNSDTSSLKINNDEEGSSEDGKYLVKRVARVGKETNFTIIATDIYGNKDMKTISVTREATTSKFVIADLNPSSIKPKSLSKDSVAIIIGISNYKKLPKAEFANEDARYFYDYAIRALGVNPENIKLLVDDDADQTEIYRTFKSWLPPRIKKNNTNLYIFYSGHGLPTLDGQNLMLLPVHSDRDFLNETGVSQSRINAEIQATHPKSVTVFLDSCYSGMARSGEALLASARPITLRATTQIFPPEFSVITASSADQISSSSPALRHGIFSYFLMKGMEGDADVNKDGKITMGEMHNYLKENVSKQANLLNRDQQPQLSGDPNKILVEK